MASWTIGRTTRGWTLVITGRSSISPHVGREPLYSVPADAAPSSNRPTSQRSPNGVPEGALVQQLGRLVSTKGSDLMITAAQDEVQSYQRLRHTINAKMWRWRVVSGWKWRSQGEHINSLELRAILACLRWRCEHLGEHSTRILHLTDSLVCLHSLTRGRTSSRRLRRTLCRINSLLLAHNLGALWGYVHTDLNPAD